MVKVPGEGGELLDRYAKALVARRPDLVLLYGANLLLHHQKFLKDEVWNVLEQVAVAAIEYRKDDWVKYCLTRLRLKFPNSIRVRKLEGMAFEGQQKFESALGVYNKILEEKADDASTRRRIISIFRKENLLPECVDMLNRHLLEFATDAQAWQELGQIYTSELLLSKALFCYEEALLLDFRRPYIIITAAELMFSLGDVAISRNYFCFALDFEPTNSRALWGYILCNAHQVANPPGKKASITDEAKEKSAKVRQNLTRHVSQRLTSLYSSGDAETKKSSKEVKEVSCASVALRVLEQLRSNSFGAED